MPAKPLPYSQAVLRLTYRYDPDTGSFTWFDGRPVNVVFRRAYACVTISRDAGDVSLARLLWSYVHGEEPEVVTFIGDPLDWRMSNIKAMTRRDFARWINQRRRAGVKKPSVSNAARGTRGSSATPGVSWSATKQRWVARVQAGGGRKLLGYWDREEDAVAAVEAHGRGVAPPVPPPGRGGATRGKGVSGAAGVSFDKGAWKACGRRNGKRLHLGRFKTKEEAIAARKKWEEENGAA